MRAPPELVMVWRVFLAVLVVWLVVVVCRVVFGHVSRGTVCVVRTFWFGWATFFLLSDRVCTGGPDVTLERHSPVLRELLDGGFVEGGSFGGCCCCSFW